MERILWDRTTCVGCRMCEAMCSLFHEHEFNPTKSRIKVTRATRDGQLYPIAVFCLQCEHPFCQDACPVGAISRDARGVMIVNTSKCIGCKLCEIACPVGAISVHPEKHVALKCDLCSGLPEPQCAKHCSQRYAALQYVKAEKVGKTLARSKAQKFVDMAGRGD